MSAGVSYQENEGSYEQTQHIPSYIKGKQIKIVVGNEFEIKGGFIDGKEVDIEAVKLEIKQVMDSSRSENSGSGFGIGFTVTWGGVMPYGSVNGQNDISKSSFINFISGITGESVNIKTSKLVYNVEDISGEAVSIIADEIEYIERPQGKDVHVRNSYSLGASVGIDGKMRYSAEFAHQSGAGTFSGYALPEVLEAVTVLKKWLEKQTQGQTEDGYTTIGGPDFKGKYPDSVEEVELSQDDITKLEIFNKFVEVLVENGVTGEEERQKVTDLIKENEDKARPSVLLAAAQAIPIAIYLSGALLAALIGDKLAEDYPKLQKFFENLSYEYKVKEQLEKNKVSEGEKSGKKFSGSTTTGTPPDDDDPRKQDKWKEWIKNKDGKWHHPEAKNFEGIPNKPNAQDQTLQKIYDELWRKDDKIPGGSAQILREEIRAGQLNPKHLEKVEQRLNQLLKRIEKANIGQAPLARIERVYSFKG